MNRYTNGIKTAFLLGLMAAVIMAIGAWLGGTQGLVIAFVIWGIGDKESLNTTTTEVLGWITKNLGWLFILSATGFVIFAVFLAVSKYGRIPLGRTGEKPQFRTVSWIAMMFSAGMGIGLMFFGAYEPLYHFASPPPEIGSDDIRAAMATTMFHWGFHPWAMYAVVGLALAYSTYRLGRTQLMSAVFTRLLGPRVANGPGGKIIDILAIFATLFGTVASLGLGALQIGSGLDTLGWVNEPTKMLLVAIIAILTAAFVASAVSGIARGIQWLSNINMVLAIVLALFVFVVGPTIFILNLLPTTLGAYFTDLTSFAARSDATIMTEEGHQWLADWTIFYWAWWVSWTPFVGLFLAKISRGRTIRQFVVGTMVIPFSYIVMWVSIFGNSAIDRIRSGAAFPVEVGGEAMSLMLDVGCASGFFLEHAQARIRRERGTGQRIARGRRLGLHALPPAQGQQLAREQVDLPLLPHHHLVQPVQRVFHVAGLDLQLGQAGFVVVGVAHGVIGTHHGKPAG